jgi:2-polyprenyl-6-methoxyphenol hydroxylase-like FAD-dependent oxidoreductase
MLQYCSQGACQAMEDAVCLSHALLQHSGDYAAALETYVSSAFRVPRARAVSIPRHRRAHLRPIFAISSISATAPFARRSRLSPTVVLRGSLRSHLRMTGFFKNALVWLAGRTPGGLSQKTNGF